MIATWLEAMLLRWGLGAHLVTHASHGQVTGITAQGQMRGQDPKVQHRLHLAAHPDAASTLHSGFISGAGG